MAKVKILVVDDEADMLETCQDVLKSDTVEVMTEPRSPFAAKRVGEERFDLALVDLKMPEMDGLSLLEQIKAVSPDTVVILLTGFPTIETAVEAVKKGAFDYLTKPFTPDQLRAAVGRAIEKKLLQEENRLLCQEVEQKGRFHHLIGTAPPMQRLFRMIEQVAATDSDVLIVGESGTGKELVARSLHAAGKRREKHFVPIDCGAIPENLLENELFGHERGAFTGAQSSSLGLLEFAHEGTLFLDEICELHPSLQAKLLRVLQERQFRRIGGREIVNIDLQVIAATNRNIDIEVKEKRFREDLFYRINVVRITIPPLRERAEDISLLVNHFLERYSRQWEKEIRGIDDEAMEVLCHYPWPGNIRELQNVVKRTVVLCRNSRMTVDDLPHEIVELKGTEESPASHAGFFGWRSRKMTALESEYLRSLLARHQGDVTKAAGEARIPRGTFYRLVKKHRLKPGDFRK